MRYSNIQITARAMVCAILLGFAGAVSADEIPEPKSVAEELLEILHAAGTINDAQYRDLSERARAEESQRIEAAVAAATSAAVAGANRAVDEAVETAALLSTNSAPNPVPPIGNSSGAMASSSIATMEPSSSGLAAVS